MNRPGTGRNYQWMLVGLHAVVWVLLALSVGISALAFGLKETAPARQRVA